MTRPHAAHFSGLVHLDCSLEVGRGFFAFNNCHVKAGGLDKEPQGRIHAFSRFSSMSADAEVSITTFGAG